jgi:hypothetical protein
MLSDTCAVSETGCLRRGRARRLPPERAAPLDRDLRWRSSGLALCVQCDVSDDGVLMCGRAGIAMAVVGVPGGWWSVGVGLGGGWLGVGIWMQLHGGLVHGGLAPEPRPPAVSAPPSCLPARPFIILSPALSFALQQ